VALRVSALVACAALALAVAAVPAAAAADGLSSMLAPAPGADWVESQPAPTILDGPFDAHAYAAYLQALAPRSPSLETALRNLTFQDGYARAWVQTGSNDALAERVFQFGDAAGAGAWYTSLQRQNQGTKYLVRQVPAIDGNPNSFGVVLRGPDGAYSYRVEFLVSRLVFTVHMDSIKNDLTGVALRQALTEFEANPMPTAAAPPAAIAQPVTPRLNLLAIVGALAALDVVVTAIALVVVRRRRRAQGKAGLTV